MKSPKEEMAKCLGESVKRLNEVTDTNLIIPGLDFSQRSVVSTHLRGNLKFIPTKKCPIIEKLFT